MRHRNLLETSTLRRSPRFQKESPTFTEAPKTPRRAVRKNRVPFSPATAEDSPDESQKIRRDGRSRNLRGSKKSSSRNEKSTPLPSLRRSPRLSQVASDEKTKERAADSRSFGSIAMEKRVTRSSVRGSKNGGGGAAKSCYTLRKCSSARDIGEKVQADGVCRIEKRVTRSSVRDSKNGGGGGAVKGSHTLRKCRSARDTGDKVQADGMCRIEKRVTRSATRRIQAVKNSECGDVEEVADQGEADFGRELFREDAVEKSDEASSVGGEDVADEMRSSEVEKKVAGIKRKREQVQSNGWTMEQESALERAYFTAKPTPRFWKKVAKMVPGKSAKECFDKIHSQLMTPPQHRPRSRVKPKALSVSLSPTKLLMSPVPETKKQKRSRFGHKTARELLKKQCNNSEQDYPGDLFSVLEQTVDPPTQIENNRQLFTPEPDVETPLNDKRRTGQSSASRKHDSGATDLTSPPVLKKVKNRALHDKYIDLLHCREAKRKAASKRAGKSSKRGNGSEQSPAQKLAAVKDAKNALFSCANEAVYHLQHLQSSNQSDNESDDILDGSEDGSEDS